MQGISQPFDASTRIPSTQIECRVPSILKHNIFCQQSIYHTYTTISEGVEVIIRSGKPHYLGQLNRTAMPKSATDRQNDFGPPKITW